MRPRNLFWLLSILTTFLVLSSACVPQNTTPPRSLPEAGAEAYVIGPEDVLEISVWQNQDLSRTVTVRPDGRISLPLINDVQAAGLTTEELKNQIAARLKPYVEVPNVAVIVQQINSWRVYIQGEVRSPGVYPLRSQTRISQAIAMAGGFTEFAKKGKIRVVRKTRGATEFIDVNYNNILSNKSVQDDIYLRPGDTIIVP